MKGLFVTVNGVNDEAFGGAKASIRNYKALSSFSEVEVYHVKKKSSLKSLISLLQFNYPPLLNSDIKKIKTLLENNSFDYVFFDYSAFGKLVKTIKRIGIKSYVFYHNCESDYIEVRFGKAFSLKKCIYSLVVKYSEKISTRDSDYRIVFTLRDKEIIESKYKTNVDYIIPIGIEDKYCEIEGNTKDTYCLLFGPAGTANVEAFLWFINNVSPHLHCKTLIAGKGFEKYKSKWEEEGVEVLGFVDNIGELYANANCVAIPLFSGGGMKIKTAEALMFGKTIFGTDEAFVGYDINIDAIGARCNNKEDFIQRINNHVLEGKASFNQESRNVYLEKYSISAGEKSFRVLFNKQSPENQ